MVRDTLPSQDAFTHQIWNSYLKEYRRYQGWTQEGCLWGALEAAGLKWSAQSVSGGRVWEGGGTPRSLNLPRNFLKIYVSENAFQAILMPFFPCFITSILIKVRHSNTRGWGSTLVFNTKVGLGFLFFLVQNFEFGLFFWGGGFRKIDILLGMLLWIHHKIGLNLGVISMHFRVLRSKSRFC